MSSVALSSNPSEALLVVWGVIQRLFLEDFLQIFADSEVEPFFFKIKESRRSLLEISCIGRGMGLEIVVSDILTSFSDTGEGRRSSVGLATQSVGVAASAAHYELGFAWHEEALEPNGPKNLGHFLSQGKKAQ